MRALLGRAGGLLVGVVRATAAVMVLIVGTVVVILVSPLPIRVRGISLAAWVTTFVCRLAPPLFGIRIEISPDTRAAIRVHRGLLFANHYSYFDILALQAIWPLRYLSAKENEKLPLIGTVARSIGTVFVDRSDRESRTAARDAVADSPKFPALVIFPEGGLGPGHELRPFRYGAFEIAVEDSLLVLPIVIRYADREAVRWGEEGLHVALWRMMRRTAPTSVRLEHLETLQCGAGDDAEALAVDMHRNLSARLGLDPVQ
jgi:1-acyl-sn-glycerol-3-phosphate acyltransferase